MCLDDFKFKHPFTFIVSGMTGSGKTVFVRRFLNNWKNLMLTDKTQIKILWCFSEDGSLFNDHFKNAHIIFHKGIPQMKYIIKNKPDLIILDDLMDDITSEMRDMFTKGSHHLGISVIFVVQNLHNKNKYMKTISSNTQYAVLMEGIRNIGPLKYYTRDMFPRKSKQIEEIFNHATQNSFGYLVIDCHPRTKREYRFRTRIFREELPNHLKEKHSFCPIFYKI